MRYEADNFYFFIAVLFLFIVLCVFSCFIFGVVHTVTLALLLLAVITGIGVGFIYMMQSNR